MDIITRQEAAAAGLKHYFTGKPCKHGHMAKKYVKSAQCTACINAPDKQAKRNEYTKVYRKTEAGKEVGKRFYQKKRSESHETYLWYHAKTRAKQEQLPFDITIEDVKAAFPFDGLCPILRIPLLTSNRVTPNSPSLDKIKPSMGYVKGNIIILSFKANGMKSDVEDPEVFRRFSRLLEHGKL